MLFRSLYTARLFVEPDSLYLGFGADAGDLRFPSGVAPLSMKVENGQDGTHVITVRSASGAKFDLSNPINRITVEAGDGATAEVHGALITVNGSATLKARGESTIRVVYERARSNETAPWLPVSQTRGIDAGEVLDLIIPV